MTYSRIQFILACLLLAFLCAVVLEQALPLFSEPDRDNGIYLYMGKQINAGKLPYVDAWEQKPPLIFYINAAGLALANGSRWGVFFLEFVFLFSAGLLFYRFANALWGFEAAILSSAVWLLSLQLVLQGGNLTEEYSLPLNFLSIALFWLAEQKQNPRHYFWIGLCFALTFFIRPNNAGVPIAIVLSLLLGWIFNGQSASPVRKWMWFAGGSAIPTLAIIFYFMSQEILDEMIEVGFLYNFSYGSQYDLLGSLTAGAARLSPIWWLAVLGYLGWALRVWNDSSTNRVLPKPLDIAPLILLPLEVALSGLSGRNYGHYFMCWLPALAFFSAYAIHSAIRPIAQNGNRGGVLIFLTVTSFLLATHAGTVNIYLRAFERLAFDRSQGIDRISPVADYIRNNTLPSETVLVWSSRPGINFMADRESPTAYFGYPAYVSPKFMSKYEEIFLHDITTNPPELIVDSSSLEFHFLPSLDPVVREQQLREDKKDTLFFPDKIDVFFELVQSHYHVELQIDEYIVYRLNE